MIAVLSVAVNFDLLTLFIGSGEFMPENRQQLKCEEEKELNKLDSWKASLLDRILTFYFNILRSCFFTLSQ